MNRFLNNISVVIGLLSFSFGAMAEQPLLQEGKKTVFQRAVSNPDAVLYKDAEGKTELEKPRTFTSYYLYEKQGNMVRVGVSANGSQGWIKADSLTEWPQAITMVFTDQMGRQPVLFFKDLDSVVNMCTSESIKNDTIKYIDMFKTKPVNLPADSPVIAAEPLDSQVSQKNFYLLPVLNMDKRFYESGTQLLQVACLDPGIQKAGEKKSDNKGNTSTEKAMTTGIVFVVDTTISMKPYIDATKELIRKTFDQLSSSKAKEHISFAVVAFRSNVSLRPNTEYNTLIVSDFKNVSHRDELEAMLDKLDEAKASTHDFNEDAIAGVKDAVDKLSWDKVDGKQILFISDAGPLTDKTSRTQMSAEAMADYLKTNHIFLTALHVKTSKNVQNGNFSYAEKNYKELSKLSNNRSSYVVINADTPQHGAENFKKVTTKVAQVYTKIVEKQIEGAKAEKPKVENNADNSPEAVAERIAEMTGYAMQLQFAGNRDEITAPHVVNAWIADADLTLLEANPSDAPVPVVFPAVLLTKAQLNTLREQVKTIIETAEQAFLSDDNSDFNFYDQLISAAAKMARDPSSLNENPKDNLAQKGVLLEVLDGLPYKSRILGLQRDDWVNMSTGEQQEFIKRLKGLVRLYEEYDKDNSHWESFGTKNADEWVYRVPLNVLP
ncbi:vWA domain-containing protein [Succinivibrio dextrinosolvens]|uniref:vWA domain-containing protein n=1 Tax=Succinivibrio dextrinosolvens TaxID=83771 RepID=UPI0019223F04|nr:vWA domain-containing protein [Succinivibrio dextrinosolvens]